MKVALVLERFDIRRGGAERSTYELACALAELGVEVTLLAAKITTEEKKPLPFAAKQVSCSGLTRTAQWHSFERSVTEHVSQTDYDIVHSMAPIIAADVYQPRGGSLLYSRQRHAQSFDHRMVCAWKRATGSFNQLRRVKIAREKRICASLKGPTVTALSLYVQAQFKTLYGMRNGKLALAPNGVATNTLCSEQAIREGAKLRSLFDPDGNLALFVFAAENLRLKGLGWLLRAAKRATNRRQPHQRDFRIFVISREDYTPYWKQAYRLGIDGRVLFIGSTEQMAAVLQMCDAVVLPTFNDACSRLILEGLAAGKPGITTRYNGAADFLGEGKYGCVLEKCGDTRALAEALLTLCQKDQQQTISQAIKDDRLCEKVSMQRHARQQLTLYEKILQDRKDD